MATVESAVQESFGDLLRRYRLAAGLSQEALAERARMSARAISDLERGTHQAPYRDTVRLLAEALGLEASERAGFEAAARRPRPPRLPGSSRRSGSAPPEPVPVQATPSPSQVAPASGLLATKLTIPPARPLLVSRPRLLDRLTLGLRGPLTLLAAPAGSGKTTLLAAWRATPAGTTMPMAWVSLDAADNDPARFWAYVFTALDAVRPGVATSALALLHTPQPPPAEALLAGVLNALAKVSVDQVLVLDDYHVIDAPAIHRGLVFLLDHLPACLHLLLATRADPPLPLARLRARGTVVEIRDGDLRCTPDEAAAFLTEVMGLPLSPDQIGALERRTEGWMAGLQLAALSLRDRPAEAIAPFIAAFSGSHRYVVDYLADEVLGQQSEPVQTFLLNTAVLERLCAGVCEAVLADDGAAPSAGAPESQAMLEQLERANLFVIALDDERRWYRYHQLFAEVLRHRLQRNHPGLLSALHGRASAWYEEQGIHSEAVRHALAAGDAARAALLIEQLAQPLLDRGEVATVRTWLETLPRETLRARPRLCLASAWVAILADRSDEVEAYVRDAESILTAHSAEDRALLGEAAVLRAELAMMRGEITHTIELCRQARTLLGDNQLALRGMVSLILGGAHRRSGDVTAASQAYVEAIRLAEAAGNMLYVLIASINQGALQEARGRLREAAATYRHALRRASDAGGAPLPVACSAYVGLGGLCWEWNKLDAAAEYLQTGIELASQAGIEGALFEGRLKMALILQARGQADSAHELTLQAMHITRHWDTHTRQRVAAIEAWFNLILGRVDEAIRWADEIDIGIEDDLSEARELEYLALARVLIAQGRAQPGVLYIGRAAYLLARLLQETETAGRIGRVIEILALQALTHRIQGNFAEAMAALERALALAEPEGYVRLFLDEGTPMAALLREAYGQGIAPTYVGALLAALGVREEHPPAGAP